MEILRTDRLILREREPADAETLHRLHSDSLVMKYTCEPMSSSLEEMCDTLAGFIARRAELGFERWLVVHEDEAIGWSGPKYIEELGEVDIGYRFFPEHWGKGFATEACAGVVAHCFGPLDIPRLIGLTKPENVASQRVLEKNGFTFEREIEVYGTDAQQFGLDRG